MTVAIPKHRFRKPEIPPSGVSIDEDENYFYLIIQEEGAVEKVLNLHRV